MVYHYIVLLCSSDNVDELSFLLTAVIASNIITNIESSNETASQTLATMMVMMAAMTMMSPAIAPMMVPLMATTSVLLINSNMDQSKHDSKDVCYVHQHNLKYINAIRYTD